MPTYEYKCLACDNRFERFQGINAPPIEECPECKGEVKRLIGAGAGLIFKGSGFYITDYRSDGYKESAKKEKSDSSEKSSTSEKSGTKETKTDTSSSESTAKAAD